MAAWTLPLGAHSPEELGDEAALLGADVPMECDPLSAACGCWWGSPGSNGVLCSFPPSQAEWFLLLAAVWDRTESLGASPVVGSCELSMWPGG